MTAEDRKLAIVKAALPLFAQKGFTETTTKDLARAAGISGPLLYKHFPSQEALYLEIQAFSCRGIDPVVQKLSELEPSTSTSGKGGVTNYRSMILGISAAFQPAGSS